MTTFESPALVEPMDGMGSTGPESRPERGTTRTATEGGGTSAVAGRPARKRRPKDIGTDAERAVMKHLLANGFPTCERRALRGREDAGDLTGTPGVAWSIKGGERAKNASDKQVDAWLAELEKQRQRAGADVGVLVLQRRGAGPANAGRWWAVMDAATLFQLHGGSQVWGLLGAYYTAGMPVRLLLADAVTLLRKGGYGDPLPEVST